MNDFSLKDAVHSALNTRNYTFSGRIRRSVFGVHILFYLLLNYVLYLLLRIAEHSVFETYIGILFAMVFIACYFNFFSLSWRRLHDTGKSGALTLLMFIPFIGIIVLAIFYCQDSQPEENRYGRNPKELSTE